MDAESRRLEEVRTRAVPWRKWGPYARWCAFPSAENRLAGISDDQQRLCFAIKLWNGRHPIFTNRLSGLNGCLNSTPTHSYMKYLYKHAQSDLFDDGERFDIFVEYAKESPEDVLIQIAIHNRGLLPSKVHVLPTIWLRPTWAAKGDAVRPTLREAPGPGWTIAASHPDLGDRFLSAENASALFFAEHETIAGAKASAYYSLTITPGHSRTLRLRLSDVPRTPVLGPGNHTGPFGGRFETVMTVRRREADEFYRAISTTERTSRLQGPAASLTTS